MRRTSLLDPAGVHFWKDCGHDLKEDLHENPRIEAPKKIATEYFSAKKGIRNFIDEGRTSSQLITLITLYSSA